MDKIEEKGIKFNILENGKVIAVVSYDSIDNSKSFVDTNEKTFKIILNNANLNDIQKFLKSRVFPKRKDCKDTLNKLGLYEYDVLEIIKKTNGRLLKDNISVEIL